MSKICVLLISGDNNHRWQWTTPYFKMVLEASGLFNVDITEQPSEILGDAAKLSEYQLFLLDYNGAEWTDEAKHNFEQAVAQGTGVVFIHASNNAFDGWEAYEKMLGLAWGENSGHGDFHEFKVEFSETEHPITKGLADFKTWDELYHRMVPMHNVPFQVLATAYSDPETKGTGLVEPLMLALEYGKGRIFHQLLGHVWPDDYGGGYKGATMIAVENESFKICLIRGSEWAATGVVSEEVQGD